MAVFCYEKGGTVKLLEKNNTIQVKKVLDIFKNRGRISSCV